MVITFPVHQTVIAAHSTVLRKALVDFRPPETEKQVQSTGCPRLPLFGDSCTAVQAALKCMYEIGIPAQKNTEGQPRPRAVTLREALELADHILFTHKYEVIQDMHFQQDTLLLYIRQLHTNDRIYQLSPDLDVVFKCIALAERCGLTEILQACLAVIASNFTVSLYRQTGLLSQTLTTPSLLATVSAAVQCQKQLAANVSNAVEDYTSQMEAFLVQHAERYKEMQCPKCQQAVKLVRKNKTTQGDNGPPERHLEHAVYDFDTKCVWPYHMLTISPVKGAEVEDFVTSAYQSFE